jgi:hypothetical protein
VLTLTVGPPFGMPSNADFRFALVLNGRDLMSDVVISPPASFDRAPPPPQD